MKRRGVTLILTISVLITLVLLAQILVTIASTEVQVTSNAIALTKARLAATSGFEEALVRLRADFEHGTLWTPQAAWRFPGPDRPLEEASIPSYPLYQKAVGAMHALPLPFSGLLESGQKTPITFALKITDEQSKIYVNGGDPSTPNAPYNQALQNLLDRLGEVAGVPELGKQLIERRPRNGYQNPLELQQALKESDYKKVKDFLTLQAWVDPQTVRPVPLADRYHSSFFPPLSLGSEMIAYQQLEPRRVVLEPRAPININSAAQSILVALLWNLQGFYVDESNVPVEAYRPPTHGEDILNKNGFSIRRSPSPQPSPQEGEGGDRKPNALGYNIVPGVPFHPRPFPLGRIQATLPISRAQAEGIAERILLRRAQKPFSSWSDFYQFCQQMVEGGLLDPFQADVLKANANPNTDVNFRNPPVALYKSVDKLSLLTYSTEFTFLPSGIFSVESLGRVGKEAEAKFHALVQIYHLVRDTTQQDFMREGFRASWLGTGGRPGQTRGSAPTVPELTREGGGLDFYPQAMEWIPASAGMTRRGRERLQEAGRIQKGAGRIPQGVSYDGYFTLATLKQPLEREYPQAVTLRASFDHSLQADFVQGGGQPQGADLPLPDEGGDARLFPDGAYSEVFRTLRYPIQQKFETEKPMPDQKGPNGRTHRMGEHTGSPLQTPSTGGGPPPFPHLLKIFHGPGKSTVGSQQSGSREVKKSRSLGVESWPSTVRSETIPVTSFFSHETVKISNPQELTLLLKSIREALFYTDASHPIKTLTLKHLSESAALFKNIQILTCCLWRVDGLPRMGEHVGSPLQTPSRPGEPLTPARVAVATSPRGGKETKAPHSASGGSATPKGGGRPFPSPHSTIYIAVQSFNYDLIEKRLPWLEFKKGWLAQCRDRHVKCRRENPDQWTVNNGQSSSGNQLLPGPFLKQESSPASLSPALTPCNALSPEQQRKLFQAYQASSHESDFPGTSSPSDVNQKNSSPEQSGHTSSSPASTCSTAYPDQEVPVNLPFLSASASDPTNPLSHLTLKRQNLISLLCRLNVDQIFSNFARTEPSPYTLKDIQQSPEVTLFMPHSCCFWDVYFKVPSANGNDSDPAHPNIKGVHFLVPPHYETWIEQAFPKELVQEYNHLCADEGETCPIKWTPPPPQIIAGGVHFWFKPNWGEKSYPPGGGSPKGHILLALGRRARDLALPLHAHGYSPLCVSPNFFYLNPRGGEGTPYLNVWDSRAVQDWYAAYLPSFFFARGNETPLSGTPFPQAWVASPFPSFLKVYMNSRIGLEKEQGEITTRSYQSPSFSWQAHHWYSVDFRFNTDWPDSETVQVFINGNRLPTQPGKGHETGPLSGVEALAEDVSDGIRFGELLRRSYAALDRAPSDPWAWGFAGADATYDEISIFKTPFAESLPAQWYAQGRYLNAPEVDYVSSLKQTEPYSRIVALTTTLYPGETPYVGFFDVLKAEGPPPAEGLSLADGQPLSPTLPLSLSHTDQVFLFNQTRSLTGNGVQNQTVGRDGTFRYRFRFRSQDTRRPIYESFVVDDITLLALPPVPTILQTYWE